jgi:hypothetical protein
MPEIIKIYREQMPTLRLIGKRYTDKDRGADGGFANKWGEWFQNGWLGTLEALGRLPGDKGAYLGCMSVAGGFSYWIGMFFPRDTPVPIGFEHVDIPAGDVGLCWIYGNKETGEIFGQKPHELCVAKILEEGWEIAEDFANSQCPWFFERYQSPRFTTADVHGNVILDYGIYIKP